MQGLKTALDIINDEFLPGNNSLVKRIVEGSPDDFLTDKKNFYPAINIDYGDITFSDQTITVAMEMVIVDLYDEDLANEMEVFRRCGFIAARVTSLFQHASDEEPIHINDDPVGNRVVPEDDGPANLTGVLTTFNLIIPNPAHTC